MRECVDGRVQLLLTGVDRGSLNSFFGWLADN